MKKHISLPYELKKSSKKSMKEGKEGVVKEEGVAVGQLEAKMRPKRKMKMWVLADTEK